MVSQILALSSVLSLVFAVVAQGHPDAAPHGKAGAPSHLAELEIDPDEMIGKERVVNIDEEIARRELVVEIVINEITGERQLASSARDGFSMTYIKKPKFPELK